jgi:hypothetical protein
MAEYFDRLPWDKIDKLREIAGGELNWHKTVPCLSPEKKAEFGRIVFGKDVKGLKIKQERDVSTGYDIPVIIAAEL